MPRCDPGAGSRAPERAASQDLRALVEAALGDARILGEDRAIQFEFALPPHAEEFVDARYFTGILPNLPSNAVKCNRDGGTVRVPQLAVVFHHESGAQTPANLHSPLVKMLASLAQSSSATQDHVLTFAQVDAAGATARIFAPSAISAAVPPLAETFVLLPLPATAAAPIPTPLPPPMSAFALTCLRSTRLLV